MVEKIQTNRERSIASRLLSGGAWVLTGRMISAIGGLLVSMLLARALTPTELGAYFIVVSITVTGAMLAQFGTHLSVMRIIAAGLALGELKEVKRGLKAVLLIVLTGILIIAGGYTAGAGNWIALHIFDSELVSSVTGLTALWLALRVGQTLLSQVFRGFHDLRLAAIFSGAFTQVLLFLALLVLWLSIDSLLFEQAVKVTVAAFAITVIIGLFLLRRYMAGLPCIRGMSLRETVNRSAPLFISSTSIIVLGEMHLWILGAVATPDQVALYGASYRLMLLVLMPLNLVNSLIPPMVAELYAKKNLLKVEQVLRTTASLAAMPSLLVILFFILFSKQLLGVTYGTYFEQGYPILIIMAIGQGINVLTGSPGVLLSMTDYQRILMIISVISGLVGILISASLVYRYGVIGVAFGYTAGLVIQNVTMSIFSWYRLDIKTFAGRDAIADLFMRIRSTVAQHSDLK